MPRHGINKRGAAAIRCVSSQLSPNPDAPSDHAVPLGTS